MAAALAYFFFVLLANLTATLFFPVPLGPLGGMEISIGTLIFGLTFTQRDRMHWKGRRFVYSVIFLTAIVNVVVVSTVARLWAPGWAESWHNAGATWMAAGARDLALTSARVLLASFLAIIIAESADTEVYHRLLHRSWMVRVLRSNAVSIPIDTVIFNVVAFGGVFPPQRILGIMAGEVIVKFMIAAAWALWVPKRDPHRNRPIQPLPSPAQ